MPRAKKEYKMLTIKLEKSVSDKLEEYCVKAGQTKTMAIERILLAYFMKDDRANK